MKHLPLFFLLLTACQTAPRQDNPPVTGVPIPPAKPTPKPDTLRFLVLGDWGWGSPEQRALAAEMDTFSRQFKPHFVVSVGDNFYGFGVESTTDPLWKTMFEDVYTAPSLQIPWYVALGNHDYPKNPQAQVEYSATSPRWRMPARYFTFSRKLQGEDAVRFVFLDTNPMIDNYHNNPAFAEYPNASKQDPVRQRVWLDSVLRVSPEPWKIVVGHHPVYCAGSYYFDTPELIQHLKPLLETHRVQAYLCGHEHNLQHLRVPSEVTDYFISGSGGGLRPAGRDARTRFSASDNGFAAVSIRSDSLFLQYRNKAGDLIYEMGRGRN